MILIKLYLHVCITLLPVCRNVGGLGLFIMRHMAVVS
jgi:hypothetical protein